jgi:hypothetical protein
VSWPGDVVSIRVGKKVRIKLPEEYGRRVLRIVGVRVVSYDETRNSVRAVVELESYVNGD